VFREILHWSLFSASTSHSKRLCPMCWRPILILYTHTHTHTHACEFNPLNAELNPICHLLALLGGATIVDVSRLRVKVVSTFEGCDKHFDSLLFSPVHATCPVHYVILRIFILIILEEMFFLPMPPHVPYGLRGLLSRLWPKCNRLLRLGRPWGAVTLSRWGGWWYMNMK
jgi:hypothetical protein